MTDTLAPATPSVFLEQIAWAQSEAEKEEEKRLLALFTKEHQKRYKTALVIGRFQPFHRGHFFLLKASLAIAQNIVIGIGSSNVQDGNKNPFSLQDRQDMVKKALERHKPVKDRVRDIVLLPDVPDDAIWYRETLEATGPIDVAVSNNDWIHRVFAPKGIPSLTTPLLKREKYEGETIRVKLRKMGLL